MRNERPRLAGSQSQNRMSPANLIKGTALTGHGASRYTQPHPVTAVAGRKPCPRRAERRLQPRKKKPPDHHLEQGVPERL